MSDSGLLPDGWTWSDVGHGALDVVGFVPVIGEAADLTNACWYVAEEKYLEAGLSLISCIPVVGDLIGKGGTVAVRSGSSAAAAALDVLKKMDFAEALGPYRSHRVLGPAMERIVKALGEWRANVLAKAADRSPGAIEGCKGLPAPTRSMSLAEAKKLASMDGDSPAHRAAREKVARAFYASRATLAGSNPATGKGITNSAADVEAHLSGIDLSRPVVVDTLPAGSVVYQHAAPGSTGQYFTRTAEATPDQLGINATVLVKGEGTTPPRIAPRARTEHVVEQETTVLRSTAAPVVDRWSTPGQPKVTNGGGEQVFLPRSAYENRARSAR